jgi:trehalose 6-phosphate phosphatase
MIYLLSDEGRAVLKKVANGSVLYAFDFDGTLAKISSDRGNVKLSPTMHEWLRELSRRAPCAIVSGRSLEDLAPRLNGAVPYLIGNHGMESPLRPAGALRDMERTCSGWIAQVGESKAWPLTDPRMVIENKRYSLTLHYREVENPEEIERALVQLGQQLTPSPRLIFGKASLNLLPPGSAGKGEAALALMAHLGCAGLFFIGDDDTDEAVFALKEGLTMGVRVGHHAESHARYYVKCQTEVEDVLRFLVHRLDGTPEPVRSKRSTTV